MVVEVQANAPANRFLFTVPLIAVEVIVETRETQLPRVMGGQIGGGET